VPGITVRRVALPSGLTLRVLEAGPADGSVVVLVHGWAVSVYLWRHNILSLAAAGYRVVAFDLPGHGLSDAPREAGRCALAAFVAALRELLDALGISRCSLIAQSMGGKVAVQFALEAQARVSSLQLYGPVGFGLIPPWHMLSPIIPDLPGEITTRFVTRRIVQFVQERVYGKLGWFSERDVDEYWAPSQFPDIVRAQIRMLREFAWEPWEPADVARLEPPTLVVFGTRDRTVRPVHAERLAAALPRGRLEWIADGGHVLMEEAPGRINALMLGALRG
jgi:pimeloyl-ACP methyl ester carboxylesterase